MQSEPDISWFKSTKEGWEMKDKTTNCDQSATHTVDSISYVRNFEQLLTQARLR